jgi:hypothetical protein
MVPPVPYHIGGGEREDGPSSWRRNWGHLFGGWIGTPAWRTDIKHTLDIGVWEDVIFGYESAAENGLSMCNINPLRLQKAGRGGGNAPGGLLRAGSGSLFEGALDRFSRGAIPPFSGDSRRGEGAIEPCREICPEPQWSRPATRTQPATAIFTDTELRVTYRHGLTPGRGEQ